MSDETNNNNYIFDTDNPIVLKRVCKALEAVCDEFCPKTSKLMVRWENIKITTLACTTVTTLLNYKVRLALNNIETNGGKFWSDDDIHADEARALEVYLNTYFRNPLFVFNPIEVNTVDGQTFVVMNNDSRRLAPCDALAAMNTLAKLMEEGRIVIVPKTRNRPLDR